MMTVRELIELLQECDPDLVPRFAYDYGDRWHTMVTPPIRRVEELRVIHSEYHRMHRLVEDDPFGEGEMAVVLS